jgi:hypothetical protein
MVRIHQGSPSELLRDLIVPGREPVTLICPMLPSVDVLDQAVVACDQYDRQFRVVTSIHGACPGSTRVQIDSMLRLDRFGVRIKTSERGSLPSILLAPGAGCAILPPNWGLLNSNWQKAIVIDNKDAVDLNALSDKIWRQAGANAGARRLKIALRWLEESGDIACGDMDRTDETDREPTLSDLTLFDKRRGNRKADRKRSRIDGQSWWTFHGTADERVNPFIPTRAWAMQREAHSFIRFPKGKRPTGVKTGDWIFFVLHSREPGGEPDAYIVGRARAVAYRSLIDDMAAESDDPDDFARRYPHKLNLESVQIINGAVGEGIQAQSLMISLGSALFESTTRNVEKKGGNVDPRKSITQKSMIMLSEKGASETHRLLEQAFLRLGCMSGSEIAGNEQ